MKLETYNPQVNPNTIQGKVQSPAIPAAYGADTSGIAGFSAAMGMAQKSYQMKLDEDMATEATEAMNQYNSQISDLLYNQDTGLMHKELAGAQGISQQYLQKEAQIKDKVLSGMNFRQSRQTFSNMADRANMDQGQSVLNYEYGQVEKNRELVTDNADKNALSNALKIGGMAGYNIYKTQSMGLAKANFFTRGDAYIESWTKDHNGSAAQQLLTQAIDNGDYDGAGKLIDQMERDGIVPEQNIYKYKDVLTQKKQQSMQLTSLGSLYQQYKNDPEGFVNAYTENMGKNKKPTGGLGVIASSIAQATGMPENVAYGWASFESGRGESELAAKYNNYFGIKWTGQGKYVEMPTEEIIDGERKTVTAKFQAYDSPEESAQDAVNWLKNNAPNEMSSIQSGDDLARVLKEHGYYTDSEENYAGGVDARAGEYIPETVTPEETEQWRDQALSYWQAQNKLENVQKTQQVKGILDNMAGDLANVTDYQSFENVVGQYTSGMDVLTKNEIEKQAMNYVPLNVQIVIDAGRKQAINGTGKLSADQLVILKSMIADGKIQSIDQLNGYFTTKGLAVSPGSYQELVKTLTDRQQGKGEFSIEIDADKSQVAAALAVNPDSISGGDFSIAKQLTREWAVMFHDQEGKWPSQAEIMKDIQKNLSQNVFTGVYIKGFFSSTPVNFSRTDERKNNIVGFSQTDDPNYSTVFFSDGKSYDVHTSQMENLRTGALTEAQLEEMRNG